MATSTLPMPSDPPQTSIPLPAPFNTSTTPLTLITQGAEALLYRTSFLTSTTPCALKIRPSKPYRHPTLDRRLTRQRILAEARVLVKCRREGVRNVPAVLGLDWEAGWVALEWIGGGTVRGALGRRKEKEVARRGEDGHAEKDKAELVDLLKRIGRAVGAVHAIGVVHGDLTTSNLMLRPREEKTRDGEIGARGHGLGGEIVVIDFGLAQVSAQEEDRAVDLYVLERAFGSTHPEAEGAFEEVLKAYGESYKGAKVALKRLEEVRMRGRKKSMIG